MQVEHILLCGFLIFVNIKSCSARANGEDQYQGNWAWLNNWYNQQNRVIKKDNIDDFSDKKVDNEAMDDMTGDEPISNDEMENNLKNAETKLFSNKEEDTSNANLWPEKRVYYAFSPSVDREGRQEVKSVLREWEGNSCLKFFARGTQSRYIEFVYHGRCYVGEDKPDSKQIISIGSESNMCSRGALLKGIGQAVGVKNLPDVYKRYFGPQETHVLGAEIIGRARNLYECDQIPADQKEEGDTPADLFFQTCFNYINEKRARAGVQPLQWRNDLAGQAQRWAQHLADTNSLEKDPDAKKYNEGETLSWSKPAMDKCEEEEDDMCYSCREAINTWYKERRRHHHEEPNKQDAYSQMTASWAKQVGFGSAVSNKYGRIVVARYRPESKTLVVSGSNRHDGIQKESSSKPDFFGKDCLLQHNINRVKHGSPPLKWSSKLQKHAQEWANKLAAIDTVEPDPDAKIKNDEGENLGWIAPAKPKCTEENQEDCYTCANIVQHWYDEVKNYDFVKGMSLSDKPVHHFVQMIWKKSTELGVATAESKSRGMILVARYNPRGNVESLSDDSDADEYEDNVMPPATPLTSAGVPGGQKVAPSPVVAKPPIQAAKPPDTSGAAVKPSTSGATGTPPPSGAPVKPSTSGAAAKPPTTSGAAVKPSTSGATGTPPPSGAPVKPSTSGAAAKPATSGATVKPTTSGATGTPPPSGAPVKPSTSGAAAKPATSGAAVKPSTGGATSTPSPTSAAVKPSTSGAAAKPATSGAAVKPSTNGGAAKPAISGATAKPSTSGATGKPSPSGATGKPSPSAATGKPSTTAKPTPSGATAKPTTSGAPAKSPISSIAGIPAGFIQGCVDAHNRYRKKHGIPPLTWNKDLQDRAQAWASRMAETGALDHDMYGINHFKDGENIGFAISAENRPLCEGDANPKCYHCSETVAVWYNESKNYNYKTGKSVNGKTYLHFTQLEWLKTTKMGVGVGMRTNYILGMVKPVFEIYLVVKYSPRGNYGYTADYLKNVKPAIGSTAKPGTPVAKPTGPPEAKPATPAVAKPATPAVAKPATPAVAKPATSAVAKPTGPAVAKPTGPPVGKPATPAVAKPASPAVAKPATPAVAKPATPAVAKPATSAVAKPTTPAVAKPTGPPVGKPATPAVAKPASPAVAKPATPAVAKPATPAVAKPASPAVAKPGTPAVAKPTTPAVTKPSTPAVAKPATPAVAKPATPAVAKPATPAVAKPTTPAVAKPATPAVAKPATPAVAKPASPAVAKPTTPAVAKPTGPPAGKPATPAVAKPTTPAVAKPASPAVAKPTTPAVGKPATAAVAKPATPAIAKPATPAVAKPASPAVAKPTTPAVGKPATPAVAKPTTPAVAKPTTPAVAKPATPVVAKPATPAVAKPATPAVAKPTTPAVAKPATPVVAKPATPAVAKPATPAVAKPATPAVAKPTTPAVAKPTTPAVAKPSTPAVAKPATPAVAKPASPAVAKPSTPAVAKPATPAVAKPATPAVAKPASPAVAKPTTPAVAKPTGPPVGKPATPAVAKPTTPAVAKPASPAVAKPTTPAVGKPATPALAKPTTPAVAKPATAAVAKPTTPAVAKPATPAVAKPATPAVAKPATPAVAKPTTPAVAKPTTPAVAKPSTPAVAKPATPAVAKPASPAVAKPTTPAVAKPATPAVAKPATPAVAKPTAPAVAKPATPAVAKPATPAVAKPTAPAVAKPATSAVAKPTAPAAATPVAKPTGSNEKFTKDCLDSHNILRKKHSSPPLTWSKTLEAHAQGWANSLANRDVFEHDLAGLKKYSEGENIAWFTGSATCKDVVQMWYNEIKNYDYSKGDSKSKGQTVLHFTQVVWKATTGLGVASASSKSGKIYYVARYSPRGNFGYKQAYIENVLEPGKPGVLSATPPAAKPATPSAAKPATLPAAKPATPPAAKPATLPAAKPATPPAAKPATPPAAKPATLPAAKPATLPAAKPATPPAAKPATPSAAKPATLTAAKPATPPAAKPATLTAAKPAALTAAKPATAVAKASAARSTAALDHFFKDCLEKHNIIRAKHGAAPLQWSTKLAADATNWAEYLASTNKMEHDYKKLGEKGEGENLAWLTPVKPKCSQTGQKNCYTCSEIIDAWYKEMFNYDFKSGKSTQGSIEHFVQIVWRASREIGVGTAIGNKYGLITVTRYRSKGGEGKSQDFIDNVKALNTPISPNDCQPNTCPTDKVLNCQEDPKNAANCTKWKQEGFCENFKESMKLLCPMSCGFCPAATPAGSPKFDDVSVADQADEFEQDCLDAHNIYRAKHNVPPLLWSRKLKEDAQLWANHLAELDDQLQHDGGKPLDEGENLAHFSPPSEKCYGEKGPGCVQCREVVKDWYEEESDYDFTAGHRKPGGIVLHFTQVVWKGTRYVGVATAKNKDWFITVARYSPRGNVIGQFKDNVPAEGGAITANDHAKGNDADSEQRQFKLPLPPPRKLYAPVYPEDVVYKADSNRGKELKYFATNSPYANGELTAIMDDKLPASYSYENQQAIGTNPYSVTYNDNNFSNNHLMKDMRVEDDLAANVEQNEGMLLMADGKRKKSIVKTEKQP